MNLRTNHREEILIITDEVQTLVQRLSPHGRGIATLFTPHTTAALTINENADPTVLSDLLRAYKAMVPGVHFEHAEGNSDSHLLSTLIGVTIQIPYEDGTLKLGRWQGIYFVELDGPRSREVMVYLQNSE